MSKEIVTVELRSDTFTKPSRQMLEYMIQAEVGDSIYDEDPTIIDLEAKIAKLFNKEASLFMPSGTMANLVAVMVHCMERGAEIIVGEKSHLNMWEQGGIAQVGHVYVKQIENLEDGTFDLNRLESMISDHSDRCCSATKLICIENSQNWCGGRILPIEFVEKCSELCKKYNIKLHLDGSRIMNVAAASNMDVSELCANCDTINFCFSKGIGAPVGSILIGPSDFIQKSKLKILMDDVTKNGSSVTLLRIARVIRSLSITLLKRCETARAVRVRQSLGGGMRQAGVLAACCLYGLSNAKENFLKDNANAKKLANGIAAISNGVFWVNAEKTETNIVHMKILKKSVTVNQLINRLATVTEQEEKELNKCISVKVGEVDKKTVRLLTHLDVDSEKIDLAIEKIRFVANEYSELE